MLENTKACIVLPYFVQGGALPGYFDYWLHTCSTNKGYDFLVFTDADIRCLQVPDNVHVVRVSFEGFVGRFKKVTRGECHPESPYKLCDYKPLYGAILEKELERYAWWGFCDCDLLFGDLDKFLYSSIDDGSGYERIFSRGHLSLFRNNDLNRWAWRDLPDKGTQNWKTALGTNGPRAYDEWGGHVGGGMSAKYEINRIPMDDRQVYADIKVHKHDFEVVRDAYSEYAWEKDQTHRIFIWQEGRLFDTSISPDGSVRSEECAYVHFQKRSLVIEASIGACAYILCPPNRLVGLNEPIDINDLSPDFVMKFTERKSYGFIIRDYMSRCTSRMKRIIAR